MNIRETIRRHVIEHSGTDAVARFYGYRPTDPQGLTYRHPDGHELYIKPNKRSWEHLTQGELHRGSGSMALERHLKQVHQLKLPFGERS